MLIKRLFLAVCVFCVFSGTAFAIDITADYKHYDKYRDVLIAKGNVVVTGIDFRIESPYVIRYFKDDKIVAMDKFVFERAGYRVAGNNLEYNYSTGSGNAERIRINFGETFLGGRYMTMSNDKFELYDGYFTGCNAPSSDYHFSAQQIALYPNTGLIVAYYATCWVWIAPVIPLPTFVYSAPVPKSKFREKRKVSEAPPIEVQEQREGIKTTQPVPEIGSNPVDGNFIRQQFNWYFTPRSYAKLFLSYADKTRFGPELSANYIINNQCEGEVRLGSNEGEGFFWGITQYFSLGEKLISKEDEQWLIYDFYKPGGKYAYELEVKYSFRERPNLNNNIGPFSRVSYNPLVTLRSNRAPLPLLGRPFTYYWEASHTDLVSEEVSEFETTSAEGYTVSSPRTNYYADITYENDFGWVGKLKAMVDGSFSDYGPETGSWDRSRQVILLQQSFFDKLTLEYGHVHYILQRGYTPYLFEGYYYAPYDQFVGSLKIKAWFSYFQVQTSYNLPSWALWSVKYQWLIGMHCYNLLFEYDLRNEIDKYEGTFNFSFELVPSRW